MRRTILVLAFVAGLALTGVAAGLNASTISYAGPVEVVRVETVTGTDYTVISRHAAVEAALASITDSSASKHYIVKLPPGTFTVSAPLVLKPYVDLEGAGQDMTTIEGYGSDTDIFSDTSSATVVAADNSELRYLTITSDATGKSYATGLYINTASPSVSHVSVGASNGSGYNFGIFSFNGNPTLTDVISVGTNGSIATGIYAWLGGPSMTQVSAIGGLGDTSEGLYATASSFTSRDSLFAGIGGLVSYGIHFTYTSSPASITETTALASGASNNNYGLQTVEAPATLDDVYIDAAGTGSHGIDTNSSGGVFTLTARNSFVRGGTNSVYNTSPNVIRFGASQLSGAVNNFAGATLYCVASYNSVFTPLASNCASGGPGTPLLPPDASGDTTAPEPPTLPAPQELLPDGGNTLTPGSQLRLPAPFGELLNPGGN